MEHASSSTFVAPFLSSPKISISLMGSDLNQSVSFVSSPKTCNSPMSTSSVKRSRDGSSSFVSSPKTCNSPMSTSSVKCSRDGSSSFVSSPKTCNSLIDTSHAKPSSAKKLFSASQEPCFSSGISCHPSGSKIPLQRISTVNEVNIINLSFNTEW